MPAHCLMLRYTFEARNCVKSCSTCRPRGILSGLRLEQSNTNMTSADDQRAFNQHVSVKVKTTDMVIDSVFVSVPILVRNWL